MKPKNTSPRYLAILSALYITFLLLSSLIVYKLTTLAGYVISASTLIFPITYFLGDVITEVYGYKVSRQIIWSAFLSIFVFDLLGPLMAHLPSPHYWPLQNSYNQVLNPLPRVFIGDFIALNTGAFINAYLISRWKILTRGRFFWARSIGATAIGEFFFNILAFGIMFTGKIPASVIFQAALASYVLKILIAMFTAFPGSMLVFFLKKSENKDVYDHAINFNPFKLTG